MKKPVLVIMAAGIGSRYGGGIKQLAKVGPSGEIIMDYSIYDAKRAGFEKVIFVIRRDIEADFKEIIGDRISREIEVAYAYQDPDDLPSPFTRPADRTKPWGTGHAILACRELIDAPFAVINADDYYGYEAFRKIYQFLADAPETRDGHYHFAMAGFVLGNTLSDNGTVTRGICQVDADGSLMGVQETKDIARGADGHIHGVYQGQSCEPKESDLVSMNFWGYTPDFIGELERRFVTFLAGIPEGDIKAEYLLPIIVDDMLKEGVVTVDVLPTNDTWFGLTYAEDRDSVAGRLKELAENGTYPNPLFSK